MKKILLTVLFAVSSIMGSFAWTESGYCGNNLTWTFDYDTGILKIKGTGTMYHFTEISMPDEFGNPILCGYDTPWNGKEYAIKKVVVESGVESIGQNAFNGCYVLDSVVISGTVEHIGAHAFENCTELKSVNINEGVSDIGEYAFYNCYYLKSIVIPGSIKGIGASAFASCENLESVQISEGVEIINSRAFANCRSLISMTIPKSVANICDNVFSGCYSLKQVDVSCATIGSYAFANCDSLTTVRLHDGVSIIDSYAFKGCKKLTSITIPKTLYAINPYAFGGDYYITDQGLCDKLSAVYISDIGAWCKIHFNRKEDNPLYSAKKLYLDSLEVTNLVIPEGVSNINSYAFVNCNKIKSITIPSSVTNIDNDAFANCTQLSSVYISDLAAWCNIETNDNTSPLFNANKLYLDSVEVTDLDIPEGVTRIKTCLFSSFSFNSIKVPASVRCIESLAFSSDIKLKSIDLSCDSIGNSVFQGCRSLSSVKLRDGLKTIGESAFERCTTLTSIEIPSSVKSIGSDAFHGCNQLSSVYISDLSAWCEMNFSSSTSNPFNNVDNFYLDSVKVEECIVIPEGTTCINNYAFYGLSKLKTVIIPSSVTEIGSSAFGNCNEILDVQLNSSSVIKIGSYDIFGTKAVVRVPDNLYDTYKTSSYWNTLYQNNRLFATSDKIAYDVNVAAAQNTSGLIEKIKIADLPKVVSLKISGTINSYDIIVLNNKMPNLRCLDLTDARIVACDHEYYVGCKTQDNVVGDYMFYNQIKYLEIKLPKTAKSIGEYAFWTCAGLTSITIPNSVTEIGSSAFEGCKTLTSATLGNNVKSIGEYAFEGCKTLTSITIPKSVTVIRDGAFNECVNLKYVNILDLTAWCSIKFIDSFYTTSTNPLYYAKHLYLNGEEIKDLVIPNTVTDIGSILFRYCSYLNSVTIPSSVKTISKNAFSGCENLEKVYTRTIEPTDINQNTFSSLTFSNATLYVPKTSYNLYWLDPAWSQFKHLEEYDAPYDSFYVQNDYVLDDETGNIKGTPDVDLNAGSGFIHEGSEDQTLGNVHVSSDGTKTGSIIGNGHIDAAKLFFDIAVNKNKWYFFCFPYKAMLSDMKHPGEYVWRKYDGNKRANSGGTGWADMTTDCLYQGEGYIYQTNVTGSLSVEILKEQFGKFEGKDINITLTAYNSSNANNASWNLIGNPFTSYYDINDMGYNAPITIWNGSSYVAIRPGDDDYILRPFEAFFVQKPNETSEIEFKAEFRLTYNQSQVKKNKVAMKSPADNKRFVVNLTISDGENSDKTRVVFNEKQNNAYEIGCDAAKFMSTESVPQLYTLDSKNVKYSINERPEGEVAMGCVANKEGQYTISAVRMDKAVMIKDLERGVIHDLSTGDYTFASEAGTFEGRFVLMLNSDVTGIDDIKSQTGVEVAVVNGGISISGAAGKTVTIYNVGGAQVAANVTDGVVALASGTYIVAVDGVSTKVVVK